MGFLPFLGQAGIAMLPGLMNKLFGGDPQKDYRSRVNALLAPQNMGKLTNQFFQQAVGGPGYAQGQSMIAAGANQAGNQVAQNLGSRGIGTSGTGAILSGLMPSLVGSQMAGLRTGAWNQAQGQAQSSIDQQIKALSGSMGPSQTSQMFGGGLAALGPLLQALMKQYGNNGVPRTKISSPSAGYGAGNNYGAALPMPDLTSLLPKN